MKDDIFIPLIAVIFVMGFVTFIALELAAHPKDDTLKVLITHE